MTITAARAALWDTARSLHHDEEYANATIDAFATAVREEALQPREQLPVFLEALEVLKAENARAYEADATRLGLALVDELDRRAAELVRLRGEVSRLLGEAHHAAGAESRRSFLVPAKGGIEATYKVAIEYSLKHFLRESPAQGEDIFEVTLAARRAGK